MSLYVDDLFDEISRLPRDMREDALAERCAGQPSIEAEVRALLDVEAPPPPQRPIALVAGTRLGRYALERPLGTGATASVWQAFDTHLRAPTALKLLHPSGAIRRERALEAVLHEARAASGIISDYVVRIKTAGRFEGGPHFIEMELCAEHRPDQGGEEILEIGPTLAEADLDGVAEIVRVVAEAAHGVDAAHRVGVLHRDLKPGNILLTPVSRRAKVTDFGLADERLYPEPGEDTPVDRTVTVLVEARDGKVVGTPAYMPPEQAFGHPPTRTSDVYALGATLYALLVGENPYLPRKDAPIPALDVLDQVRRGPPPLLGGRARVPPRLVRIVDKAMARSARHRYRTAGAFAADLEAFLDGRVASVDGRAPVLRSALFVRRHRGIATTAAVLMAVLVVFAGMLGWLELKRQDLSASIAFSQSQLKKSQEEVAEAQLIRQGAEADKVQALAEAEAAEAARLTALEGEANAELRWRKEVAQRKAAQVAQAEAVAALADSTLALESSQAALAEVEAAILRAASELVAAQVQLAETTRLAEAEQSAREAAETAVREARLVVNDRELQLTSLEQSLDAAHAARAAAEAERDELASVLAAARIAIGVPDEVPPEALVVVKEDEGLE